MPTINQLVRKGRKTTTTKSTAPALQKGYNSRKKVQTDHRAPQKRRSTIKSRIQTVFLQFYAICIKKAHENWLL